MNIAPEIQKALTRAKLAIMEHKKTTFFAHIMLSMQHVFDDKLPTAATDGKKCYYNPDFLMQQTPPQRIGLVFHETLHPAFSHMFRRQGRSPRRWNAACDYAINLIITDNGFELPPGALLDEQYRDMSAEQIYELLDDDDYPDMDDLIEPDGDEASQEIQDRIDDVLITATQIAKEAGAEAWGAVPGSIKRYVDSLTKPKIKWDRILSPYMQRICRDEYSMSKRNRRFPDIVVPSLASPGLDSGALIFDVSGSITEQQFKDWVSEGWYVFKRFSPEKLHIGQFDSGFHVDTISRVPDFNKIEFKGGGGTDVSPVMTWANKNKPNWMVIFTDGYFDRPKLNPKVPTIWCVHSNPEWQPPFGKAIHYEIPH